MVGERDQAGLVAFSHADPITRGGDLMLIHRSPGATRQPHTSITGGGHVLQEDRGPELAQVVLDWLRSLSPPRQGAGA